MESNSATRSSMTSKSGTHGRRGRVACKSCHTRRVRCDAFEGLPCSGCAVSKVPCELIESKRGKYVRTNTKNSPGRHSWSSSTSTSQSNQPVTVASPVPNISTFSSAFYDYSNIPRVMNFPDPFANTTYFPRNDARMFEMEQSHVTESTVKEGSEMLYARVSEFHLKPRNSQRLDCRRTIYLGESFDLSYIVREVISSSPDGKECPADRSLFPLPPSIDDKARDLGYEIRLEPEQIEFLRWRGALSIPEKSISDRLVRTYFDSIHPAFPIFDRTEFAALYESNQLSLLSLQVVYLLASNLCEEEVIREAGFEDRNAARKTFLQRAKALYDADYETDKVTVVQALLLISFCWNGTMDEKDMWHWLGAAIGLAQTQGMHRSTKQSDLTVKDQRLWKRIWWSLYVRDRHAAAALGRPMRIRDDDCDVETLQESDFEEIGSADPSIFGTQKRAHILFTIHYAKLCVIFGNILLAKFTFRKPAAAVQRRKILLEGDLRAWIQNLPSELTRSGEHNTGSEKLWANILNALYNLAVILLHRPPRDSMATFTESTDRIAFDAGKAIARIVDDLLATENSALAKVFLCPTVFAALTMHIIVMSRSGPIPRKLAENHARICMLGLSEWQKSWPACGWILRLFESLLESPVVGRNPTARSSKGAEKTQIQERERERERELPPKTFGEEMDCEAAQEQIDAPLWSGGGAQEDVDGGGGGGAADGGFGDLFQGQAGQMSDVDIDVEGNGGEEMSNGNGNGERTNFEYISPPPYGYGAGLLSGMGSDFSTGNEEFLSYLMHHLPDS